MIREKVIRFGRETKLVGVLSEPPPSSATAERPAVLLVNSGILHRVGACRFHVRLARRLAEEGLTSLRFDFSGIGDSDVRRDDLAFERSAVAELREAMDQLSVSKGARAFAVIGLCSGADMAFAVALEDPRVVGLGVLDPFAYRTPRYFVHHYGPRLLQMSAWANFVRRRLPSRRAAPPATSEAPLEELDLPTYVRDFPPRERAEQDLRALLARDVRLCAIFSGGQGDHYNYQGQFADAFRSLDFGGRLLERHLPDADHIFTDLDHQREVVETLAGWLRASWPGTSPEARKRLEPARPGPAAAAVGV